MGDLRPADLLLPVAMIATLCYVMWILTLGLVGMQCCTREGTHFSTCDPPVYTRQTPLRQVIVQNYSQSTFARSRACAFSVASPR